MRKTPEVRTPRLTCCYISMFLLEWRIATTGLEPVSFWLWARRDDHFSTLLYYAGVSTGKGLLLRSPCSYRCRHQVLNPTFRFPAVAHHTAVDWGCRAHTRQGWVKYTLYASVFIQNFCQQHEPSVLQRPSHFGQRPLSWAIHIDLQQIPLKLGPYGSDSPCNQR